MQLQVLGQTFINSISLILIYILFAVGLTLSAGVFDSWNFAFGEFVMAAGFVAYLVTSKGGLGYPLAFIAAIVFVSFLGVAFEKTIFYPMRNRPGLASSLATFGAVGILQTVALLIFGGNPVGAPAIMSGQVHLGKIVFAMENLPVIIGGLLMIALLFFFIQRTKLGLAIRALQQEPTAAALQGMNIASIRIVVWIVASCMAAVAGVLLAPVESVYPTVGAGLLLQGFAVVILGGLGSIPGALIGGFALGFVNSFGMTYLGTYSYLFAFGIIMIVIVLRPQGLLGRR